MKAMNEIEVKVLEMVKRGDKLYGLAKDILMEMALREAEAQAEAK